MRYAELLHVFLRLIQILDIRFEVQGISISHVVEDPREKQHAVSAEGRSASDMIQYVQHVFGAESRN